MIVGGRAVGAPAQDPLSLCVLLASFLRSSTQRPRSSPVPCPTDNLASVRVRVEEPRPSHAQQQPPPATARWGRTTSPTATLTFVLFSDHPTLTSPNFVRSFVRKSTVALSSPSFSSTLPLPPSLSLTPLRLFPPTQPPIPPSKSALRAIQGRYGGPTFRRPFPPCDGASGAPISVSPAHSL